MASTISSEDELRPEQDSSVSVRRCRGRYGQGLVQVYTGEGKGKTTAALGLGLRAVGHGYRVRMIQFMKGTSYTGEVQAVRRLAPDFQIFQFGRDCKYADKMRLGEAVCDGCGQCFVTLGNPEPRDMRYARQAYDLAVRTLDEAQADLVILDEISNALYYGLLDAEDVANLIERRPPGVELVLTGRNMPPAILDMADLVTEMKMVKHPFESGIAARHGIEY
ncbi:MAG: cob(I)yrinic acid a,c-diamide adenosyltransferase [Bacillota bacterium]